ncbi:MAG: hypothetical protein LBQ54_14690 [Planctomycetaceae bacterium]|jgi:hypothetical protein|nr:hypothetical protein [Planctomycetaceae bacterium]
MGLQQNSSHFTTASNVFPVMPASLSLRKDTISTDTKTYDKKTVWMLKQNPFSTRFTLPGTIPYFFPSGFCKQIKDKSEKFTQFLFRSLVESDHLQTNIYLHYLIDQFQKNGSFGQITGNHGSGKSTLLSALEEVFARKEYKIHKESLHDGQRRLSYEFWQWFSELKKSPPDKSLIIVDGYEQLSWLQRFRLLLGCKIRGVGLLLTSHKPVHGIPVLYRTAASQEQLEQIVDYLLEIPAGFIDENVLARLMLTHRNNIRDVLFALHDLYQEHLPPVRN